MLEFIHPLLAAIDSNSLSAAWDFLKKGGIFMIPLGLTSIAGVMAISYKFLSLASNRVIPPSLAFQATQLQSSTSTDRTDALLKDFRDGDSVLARLGGVVLKNRNKSRAEINQAVESSAREEVLQLHAGISVLDTIITIAPLLGLIGTASGLVRIFQGLGNNSDHLLIAQGIAEALTTTIFGLSIAVPCVIAHGYFIRRIEILTARLESILSDLASAFENSNSNV
jgi:biopolymer transport protein ExbB